MKVLVFVACFVSICYSYPNFRDFIPNGYAVPDPCLLGEMWPGVGHSSADGGGKLNPFGKDFYEGGLKWTKDICEKDSDGDGKFNGEELDDPSCVWQRDQPEPSTPTGHPGVCEPMNDPKCANKNPGIICAKFFHL